MKEFDKIIGYQSIKAELMRVCDIMLNYDKYKRLGVTTPRGILLHGDPGVGKTLMAKCFIEASKRPVFICRKDKADGDFLKSITDIFDKASQNAPSIVFLDDMDKFANEDERRRDTEEYVTVQSCIDSVVGKEVFVLATANDIHKLPNSLTRVGRFDKVIEVKGPVGEDAVKIVEYYLSQKSFVEDIDARQIARLLDGRSCAELETVINEAGVYAGSAAKSKIDMDDIVRACMRVIFRAPETFESHSQEVLERIAYHEAGHAIVAELLESDTVNLVSVCKYAGDVGGVTSYYQNEDYFSNKKYMENRVMSLLGGRAATEIKYGETDVGAKSDVRRAYDIVNRFVSDYISSGFVYCNHQHVSNDFVSREELQISSDLERYYQQARKLLIDNREFLDKLAVALVERKTLTNKDVQQIKRSCNIVAA